MAPKYDPEAIETKWQAVWLQEQTFRAVNPTGEAAAAGKGSGSTYVLEMFPYPSGSAHMGHVKNYTMGDVIARFRRHQGQRVLHPMGYDAFGLNSENVAIQTGEHPAVFTERAIATINRQLRRLGVSIDWSREVATCRPEYYKWTQWLFIQFYNKGLAYKKEAPVNWCPSCQTVLANEQVIAGHCERCDTEVEAKKLNQWFFRITDYAERLLQDFDKLESWPERVITMQRNWIGKSYRRRRGLHHRAADGGGDDGAARGRRRRRRRDPGHRVHHAARHAVRSHVLHPGARASPGRGPGARQLRAARRSCATWRRAMATSAIERASTEKEKTGVFTGRYAVNPVNGALDPGLRGRLRADGVRHRRHHGGARRTTSATSPSPRSTVCRSWRSSRARRSTRTRPAG